jgi:hypothetical protein
VSVEEYKTHHYGSHRGINPTGITPLGPELDFTSPHGRDTAFAPNVTASVTTLHAPGEDSTVEVPAKIEINVRKV